MACAKQRRANSRCCAGADAGGCCANLDKGLLIAGRGEPRFGGGRILAPMRFIVCGSATRLPDSGSVERVVVDAVRGCLQQQVGTRVDPTCVLAEIGETSDNLKQVLRGTASVARANDTWIRRSACA